MRSVSQLPVDRLQRCGVNMHDRFTVFVTDDRLREFFVSRHASNRVQDGCMHASSPFVQQVCNVFAAENILGNTEQKQSRTPKAHAD
jgi:hypothetical protein